MKRKSTTRKISKGWTALDNPAPSDVLSALGALGIEATRVEDYEVYALCPGHEKRIGRAQRHSTWSVARMTGAHHCFSCGYSGTFVNLVSDVLGKTRAEAVDWIYQTGTLAHGAAVLSGEPRYSKPKVDTTTIVNEASLALFTAPPQEALASRRITAEAAERYGILWDSQNEYWITPVRDPNTFELWGWQEKNARHFKNHPKGVRKSHTLFGLDAFDPDAGPMVLVESPLDAAVMYSAGVPNAVSSFGVGWSSTQLRIMLDYTTRLVCALDNDDEGRKGNMLFVEDPSAQRFLSLTFFNYDQAPDCKDPGDMTYSQIREGMKTKYNASTIARF